MFFSDVDECEEAVRRGTTACEGNTGCRNTPGGYNCFCFEGYKLINGTCQC